MQPQLLTPGVHSHSEQQSERVERLAPCISLTEEPSDLFPARSGLQGKGERGCVGVGEGVPEELQLLFLSASEGTVSDFVPGFGHALPLDRAQS